MSDQPTLEQRFITLKIFRGKLMQGFQRKDGTISEGCETRYQAFNEEIGNVKQGLSAQGGQLKDLRKRIENLEVDTKNLFDVLNNSAWNDLMATLSSNATSITSNRLRLLEDNKNLFIADVCKFNEGLAAMESELTNIEALIKQVQNSNKPLLFTLPDNYEDTALDDIAADKQDPDANSAMFSGCVIL